MRVALLTEIISPYRIPVFNHLAKHPDIQLKVFFSAETEEHRSWRVLKDEIDFEYEVLPSLIVRRTEHLSLFFSPYVVTALIKGKFDTIICGGYHQPTHWVALVYGKITRKRVLLWNESNRRDARAHNLFKDIYKKVLIQGFDGYLVPGSAQGEYLQDFGISTSRMWKAPNAVDVKFFRDTSELYRSKKEQIKHRLDVSGPVVLYVGRLIDAKGVNDLLLAFERIRCQRDVVLILAGDGPDREKFQSIARTRGIPVKFIGFQQRDDLPMYYAIADVFVFPTHTDPWGLVLNEAMSCGLPVVVSSAAGAVDDLVEHGWNGYVYEASNVEELAKYVQELLDAPKLRQEMGAYSQQIILGYTPERCAQALQKLYWTMGRQHKMHRASARSMGAVKDTVLIAGTLLLLVLATLIGASDSWSLVLWFLGLMVAVIGAFVQTYWFLFAVAVTFILNQTFIGDGDPVLSTARWVVLSICCLFVVLQLSSEDYPAKSGLLMSSPFSSCPLLFIYLLFHRCQSYIPAQHLTSTTLHNCILDGMGLRRPGWRKEGFRHRHLVCGPMLPLGLTAIPFTSEVWQGDGRFRGLLINPNSIGLLAAICAPLFFYEWLKRKKFVILIFLVSLVVASFYQDRITDSLAMLVGLGYLVGVKNRGLAWVLILICMFGLVAVNSNINDVNSFNVQRLIDVSTIRDGSGRFSFWAANMPVIERKYSLAMDLELRMREPKRLRYRSQHMHLEFFIIRTSGLIFDPGISRIVLLIGPLFFLLIKSVLFTRNDHELTRLNALQAVLLAGLISAFFETWIYSAGNAFTFPFWVCVMLLVRRQD